MSDINGLLELCKDMKAIDEGFVCVDYTKHGPDGRSYVRSKVKNPAYLAIAHIKESSSKSLAAMLLMVMRGKEAEFLGYFPAYSNIVSKLKEAWVRYEIGAKTALETHAGLLNGEKTPDKKKELALKVKDTVYAAMLFAIFAGRCSSLDEYLKQYEQLKGAKNMLRGLIDTLKLKDLDFEESE